MKWRYIILSAVILAAIGAVVFSRYSAFEVTAQQPRRWLSGDTLWYEIDSLPFMPSERDMLIDTLLHRWPALYPKAQSMSDSFPQHVPHYAPVRWDYKIPFWDISRQSVTVWGITFSTGQASPFTRTLYPAEDYPSANVLSFPVPAPK